MKFLKGLCKAILGMLMVLAMMLLVLSFSVKGLFSDVILKSSKIVTKIAENELAENVKTGNEVIDEKIQELLEDKEIRLLAEKYIDKTLEGLVSEEALEDVNIEKDIVEFVQAHEDLIEDKLGIEITDEDYEELKEQDEYHQLTDEYKKAVNEGRDSMPDEMKTVVSYFNFFLTMKCRLILFAVLIVCTILMALLQKSFYKWIETLAISAISSGVMLLVMSIVLDAIMCYVLKQINGSGSFSTSVLTRNSLVVFVSGLVVMIVYKIIYKIAKGKKKGNEKVGGSATVVKNSAAQSATVWNNDAVDSEATNKGTVQENAAEKDRVVPENEAEVGEEVEEKSALKEEDRQENKEEVQEEKKDNLEDDASEEDII